MFDVAIVGAGVAGITAAITAKTRNCEVAVFGNDIITSDLYKAKNVDNYLGFYNISGKELCKNFLEHLNKFDININNKKVSQILSMGDYYALNAGNQFYETKAIILATGTQRQKIIKGEDEFLGKGLSYCATCDGMLFKNKIVAVTGNSPEIQEEIEFLSKIAKKIYYIKNKINNIDIKVNNNNIEIINDSINEMLGETYLKGLKLNESVLECDGLFILNNNMPINSLINGIEKTQSGEIKTDKSMKTNLPGVFAAGDCTGKPYQVQKAAGEAQVAALSAVNYLFDLKNKLKGVDNIVNNNNKR